MKPTDTSEAGLETLDLPGTRRQRLPAPPAGTPVAAEKPEAYGGVGWLPGDPSDYDREYCVSGSACGLFCGRRSRRWPNPWIWITTALRGESFWHASRAR